ncbi:MAG TPA: hypothetical protein VJB08_00395 [Candidatus Nanoarchaeia archaeon]|nr:hypothetical protein [Candidatus Nanoarchaeia archaeon]
MKVEVLKSSDDRVKQARFPELFALCVDKELLVKRFGQPTRENEWFLRLEFEQIGSVESRNPEEGLMFSVKESEPMEWSVCSNVKNKNMVFQYLRQRKIC